MVEIWATWYDSDLIELKKTTLPKVYFWNTRYYPEPNKIHLHPFFNHQGVYFSHKLWSYVTVLISRILNLKFFTFLKKLTFTEQMYLISFISTTKEKEKLNFNWSCFKFKKLGSPDLRRTLEKNFWARTLFESYYMVSKKYGPMLFRSKWMYLCNWMCIFLAFAFLQHLSMIYWTFTNFPLKLKAIKETSNTRLHQLIQN
jgi:hypothetical protein